MSFKWSNLIPSKWLQISGKPLLILVLLAAAVLPTAQPVIAETEIPTFEVIEVVEDTSVTIKTSNFPADETFTVLMGQIGSRGIGGITVATTETGEGGELELTYDIPEELKGNKLIAIRLQSESGYYSYNWFINVESAYPAVEVEEAEATPTPAPSAEPAPLSEEVEQPFTGIPSFTITEVIANTTVSIDAVDFPPDVDFKVLMGPNGSGAFGGMEVASTNSGESGAFTATYDIPEALASEYVINIRLESVDGHFYSFNWFYNVGSVQAVPPILTLETPLPDAEIEEVEEIDYSGVPAFTISAVEGGKSVTILAENLPVDDAFTVRMGEFGTRGIEGVEVGTLVFTGDKLEPQTYTIPEELAGAGLIAIRIDSEKGYYAYNWFSNVNSVVDDTEYAGILSITVTSVVKNESVTILADNLPADAEFPVYMSLMGTRGIGGTQVDTIETGAGGAIEFTFDIPEEFIDVPLIAIRIDNGVFNSYAWFNNQ